jgi:hypothetical protein
MTGQATMEASLHHPKSFSTPSISFDNLAASPFSLNSGSIAVVSSRNFTFVSRSPTPAIA